MAAPGVNSEQIQENECAQEHDHSGLEKTLAVIGDRWTIALIHHLFQGKNRFGVLLRAMEGISPKTLSLRLKKLEQEGLILREIFPEVPLHVEYHPTEKGRSLHQVIRVMDEWGQKYG